MNTNTDPFYIAARETGSTSHDLPLWGSHEENPLRLVEQPPSEITRVDVDGVPGVFQLLNVLSTAECQAFIEATESMGYTEDAAVSLGRNVRHNMNLNWIVDTTTEQRIWSRVAQCFREDTEHFLGEEALGLNQRYRFYRYGKGDYFATHTDGAWPGSRIIDGQPITDAFGDRYSLYTFLIFLSEDFNGGATQFLVDEKDPTRPARNPNEAILKGVRTPVGGVLCFPHGTHPLHCLHSSETITEGVKYIIRTDVLFSF